MTDQAKQAESGEPLEDMAQGVADGPIADGEDESGVSVMEWDNAFEEMGADAIPGGTYYVNESGLPDDYVLDGVKDEIARAIGGWIGHLKRESNNARKMSDIFRRKTWEWEKNPLHQMRFLSELVEYDDTLSNLADVTEDMAYDRLRFEDGDEDIEDIWNQMAEMWDLLHLHRAIFRETFKTSQCYVGVLWGKANLQVRDNQARKHREQFDDWKAEREGEEPETRRGNRQRRKAFSLEIPKRFTIFAPDKIVPVGNLLFGLQRYAYYADPDEHRAFETLMDPEKSRGMDHPDDPIVRSMIEGRYQPQGRELQELQALDIDTSRLWTLRRRSIFAHTMTKSDYERFAARRLAPAMELVEMKHHLRQADRAVLIGQANFLVVIKKGSDKIPAQPSEIENLRAQAKTIARVPVLVGDHRLDVEIVTPQNDRTLSDARYHTLDARLVTIGLGSFSPSRISAGAAGGTEVDDLSRVVSRRLESRRSSIASTFKRTICQWIVEINERLPDIPPDIEFRPRRVTLDFNADIVNAALKLRDRGDLSRETMLEEFGFEADAEYMRRVFELVEGHDEVFNSAVPHSSPLAQPGAQVGPGNALPPDGTGGQGGRPKGAKTEKKTKDNEKTLKQEGDE